MLKNGCFSNSYQYILYILNLVKENELKPSEEFVNIIEKYNSHKYFKFSNETNASPKNQVDEFFAFSKEYLNWKQYMGLSGLRGPEISRHLREGPWQQFKENLSDGAEHLKNTRIRRLWKKGHSLHKFRDAKLTDDGGYNLPQSQIDLLEENGNLRLTGRETKENITNIKD